MKKYFALAAIAVMILSACNNDEENNDNDNNNNYSTTGNVEIHMDHVWGMMNSSFALDSTLVHPMTGDTLEFSMFKYYISNFQLIEDNGTVWTHPESYFLVDLSVSNGNVLSIGDVPSGNYTEMNYTLGVDSTRNVSGSQSGALSTSNNMLWDWNTGYIMLKAEGLSPQAMNESFMYHLGGFSGENNIVTTKTADMSSSPLVVGDGTTSEVHLQANPAKLWHTLGSVSGTPMIHMPGANAVTMAEDFYGNVSLGSVVNQ